MATQIGNGTVLFGDGSLQSTAAPSGNLGSLGFIFENALTVTQPYTMTNSGISVGPIVNQSTVTVPAGLRWVIL